MTTEPLHVTGHCYCGGITYAVDLAAGERPIFTAYCHCDSCRRAHAAPLYHVACVDESQFRLTQGADLLVEFAKSDKHITRAFCGACGSKILNRFGAWKPGGKTPLAFFPNTLDEAIQQALPDALRPKKQNQIEECVLELEMLRTLES